MRVLITGSNGLLGQKLVKLLGEMGVDFLATAIGENRIKSIPNIQYKSLDITNLTEVEKVFEEYQPSHLIHTAAMTNVDQCEDEVEECHQLNVTAVEYLSHICEKFHIFFCHVSTDFIFDGKKGPYTEEAQPNPISIYGESKLKAEEIIQAKLKLKWAIARTVLVYGIVEDMSRSNIILWVKNSLENGKDIQVVTDQFRTPTLAEDLAMGCWLIIKKEASGIFNISGRDFITPYEMAIKTADYFNLNKSLIHKADSSNFSQRAKRPLKTGFLIEKARKELGFEPHSFEEGIHIIAQQTK